MHISNTERAHINNPYSRFLASTEHLQDGSHSHLATMIWSWVAAACWRWRFCPRLSQCPPSRPQPYLGPCRSYIFWSSFCYNFLFSNSLRLTRSCEKNTEVSCTFHPGFPNDNKKSSLTFSFLPPKSNQVPSLLGFIFMILLISILLLFSLLAPNQFQAILLFHRPCNSLISHLPRE